MTGKSSSDVTNQSVSKMSEHGVLSFISCIFHFVSKGFLIIRTE